MHFKYKGGTVGGGSAGQDLTAGDGLSREGNTLNVDNPNRGILSQTEFDALPEEQKRSGTYFVDDGSSGSSSGSAWEVYSTEETRIGTWIDGKPLYRIVVNTTSPSEIETAKAIYGLSSTTSIHKIEGYILALNNDDRLPLNFYRNSSRYIATFYDNYNNISAIVMVISHSSDKTRPVVLVLEYTKTTDKGGTA